MTFLDLFINSAISLRELCAIIRQTPKDLKGIQMDITTLKAQVADLKLDTANAIERVQVDVTELIRKASAGQVATVADLQEISDGLTSIKTALAGVDPLPDFPAAAPTPVTE